MVQKLVFLSRIMGFVKKRNFIWLGGTAIDSMTPEINLFQYAREIKLSNTKGYESYLVLDG